MSAPVGGNSSSQNVQSGPDLSAAQTKLNKYGDKIGVDKDGKECFTDPQGDTYYLENDDYTNRKYVDPQGDYYKDGVGNKVAYVKDAVKFGSFKDQTAPVVFTHGDNGGRIYQDYEYNRFLDAPLYDENGVIQKQDGKTLYKDKDGDIYYLDHARTDDLYGREFIDKDGIYYKNSEGIKFTAEEGVIENFRVEGGNRVYDNEALNPKPKSTLDVAENVDDVAQGVLGGEAAGDEEVPEVGDESEVPEDEEIGDREVEEGSEVDEEAEVGDEAPKSLSGHVVKDLTPEAHDKIKTFTEDQNLYEEFLHEKKAEAFGDTTTLLLAGAVLVGVVAFIALTVFTGGIAAGILGAAVAGVHTAQMGVHAGTRAPESLSREAGKAKNRMEDLIESDDSFVKNLRKSDEERKILGERNFEYLSKTAKKKIDSDYEKSPASEIVDELVDVMEDKTAGDNNRDVDDDVSLSDDESDYEEEAVEQQLDLPDFDPANINPDLKKLSKAEKKAKKAADKEAKKSSPTADDLGLYS